MDIKKQLYDLKTKILGEKRINAIYRGELADDIFEIEQSLDSPSDKVTTENAEEFLRKEITRLHGTSAYDSLIAFGKQDVIGFMKSYANKPEKSLSEAKCKHEYGASYGQIYRHQRCDKCGEEKG